ncbi:uridine kinase [Gorillibacterium timonense]|uniref:uridine kinase n=1 Tax=Gorillibacterium timonense TaxID=1689269 RepID=UPI00071DB750|nr:uridine kinase [Gorillibacterium timonense]
MLIIGIAGGTGSGKTTVARSIIEKLGESNVALISQDNYYADGSALSFEERTHINYDHPDSFDNALLVRQLMQLREGSAIEMPTYDFTTHTRSPKTERIELRPVVILEGMHVLVDKTLREMLDIKIFVDTESDVRVLRRILRDINERARTLESVHEQYMHSVKPMHDAFVEPSKKYADLIIPEGGENEIGISFITARIERYLSDL